MELLFDLFNLGVFLVLIIVGGVAGRINERRHLRALDEDERRTSHVVVSDLRTPPPGVTAREAWLVIGEVVVAKDYFKSFAAGLRNILGGEVRSYRPMMARARRQARVRMLDEAGRKGAAAVINVRYETSMVGGGGVEVYCYGTAITSAG